MKITAFSSRAFNQDASRAKKASLNGPVFITDRGKLAHVLMTAEYYQQLVSEQQSLVDLLAMPGADEIEFDPPKFSGPSFKPADFS